MKSGFLKIVRVEFLDKLRDDKKFANLDELKAAINADAQKARGLVGLARSDTELTEMYG